MGYSPARAIDIGSVIAGTYTIEGLIGKGGMGEVYSASHARLPGKKVAIKVLHPDIADAEALARFRREAEIASRLGHPNIVEVHDWNQLEDGTPYLVLELLQGEALSDRLRHGPIPLEDVYVILRQVGSALAAAHREGIVHRDLKPQNIFILPTDDGAGIKAKVLDFGISKIRGSTTVKTQESSLLGTPQYMAPEQATGQHSAIDGRTDVFALGAVVFEMLAGVPAFRGETIPEVVFKVVYEPAPALEAVVPGVPPHIAMAVARALAKKPDERWPDIQAFVEAVTGSPMTTARRAVGAAGGAGGPSTGGSATGAGAASGIDATAAGPLPSGGAIGRGAAGPGLGRPGADDAYAATVGSGDHGEAVSDSVRKVLASGAAPTVQQPPRSRRGWWLALAAVAVAGTAMAIAIAVGGGKRSKSDSAGSGAIGSAGAGSTITGSVTGTGSGSATVAMAAGGIDAGTAVAVVIDAAAVAVTPTAIDASVAAVALAIDAGPRVVKTSTDAGPRVVKVTTDAREAGAVTPPDGDGADRDPEVAAGLAEAKAALDGGDARGAIRIAKKILLAHPDASAMRIVKARAECAMGDREAAQGTLRKVGRPRIAATILANCTGE